MTPFRISGTAEQRAVEAMVSAARRTAYRSIKARARIYLDRPYHMDVMHPAMSTATPRKLIAIAEALLEDARRNPVRDFYCVGATNAKAALLVGRCLRRLDRATQSIAAE